MKLKNSLWKRENIKRGDVIFALILRGLFGFSILYSLIDGEYRLIPVASVSLFLTFIPVLLERSVKVTLPISFQVVLLLFIFLAQFLGEIVDYYTRYWWWDIMLHSWSGVLLGVIGFLLVYVLNEADTVKVYLSPFFVSFFAFCFVMACGVVWEIFEFTMDRVFGMNMQKSGLVDTMWDLIVCTAGAVIISVNGYFALSFNRKSVVTKAVSGFIKENPDFSLAKAPETDPEQ